MAAPFVLTNAQVLINAVDLSSRNNQVTINYKAAALDVTAMGNLTQIFLGGLLEWDMSLDFYDDEASSETMQTLFPIVGTQVVIDIKPVSGARSVTNPSYTGTGLIESITPISAKQGAVAMVKVAIKSAGTLSRATS